MDAPHDPASLTVSPIQVKQPNGQILHSTKVYQLALGTLPEEEIEAHILPVLAHSSLISLVNCVMLVVNLDSISTPWMSLKMNKYYCKLPGT